MFGNAKQLNDSCIYILISAKTHSNLHNLSPLVPAVLIIAWEASLLISLQTHILYLWLVCLAMTSTKVSSFLCSISTSVVATFSEIGLMTNTQSSTLCYVTTTIRMGTLLPCISNGTVPGTNSIILYFIVTTRMGA